MIATPLRWSPAAADDLIAIRRRSSSAPENLATMPVVWLRDILLALAEDTPPGVCLIGRFLRDSTIWSGAGQIFEAARTRNASWLGNGRSLFQIEVEAERLARAEASWQVEERHLLAALQDADFATLSLRGDLLRSAVAAAEKGADLPAGALAGWHGLLDSNIVLQYQDIDQIHWLSETQSTRVTLWIGLSLLNELERLRYAGDTRRIRDRAARFNKSIGRRQDEFLNADGAPLQDGVVGRVWGPPGRQSGYDADHLDTARALRLRGIDIRVVTADTGVQLRARIEGFSWFEPDEKKWKLPAEPTEAERAALAKQQRANAASTEQSAPKGGRQAHRQEGRFNAGLS